LYLFKLLLLSRFFKVPYVTRQPVSLFWTYHLLRQDLHRMLFLVDLSIKTVKRLFKRYCNMILLSLVFAMLNFENDLLDEPVVTGLTISSLHNFLCTLPRLAANLVWPVFLISTDLLFLRVYFVVRFFIETTDET